MSGRLFDSDFGRIGIAGHAKSGWAEMHGIAQGFLALAGDDVDPELRELLGAIRGCSAARRGMGEGSLVAPTTSAAYGVSASCAGASAGAAAR